MAINYLVAIVAQEFCVAVDNSESSEFGPIMDFVLKLLSKVVK